MRILAIETSCDETGVCLMEQKEASAEIALLGNALASQVDIHAKYGGVFPALAKRAHAEKIIPLLMDALAQAALLAPEKSMVGTAAKERIAALCTKDTILADHMERFLNEYKKPDIDYIAVTVGPGLEPALWVGVNAAKVLGVLWSVPVIAINHMEGHVVTAAFERNDEKTFTLSSPAFPVLSLLVSGGHTELVLAHQFGTYEKIGQTRDDAVGEAFDKVARMLDLPYPGGPAISKLAADFRLSGNAQPFSLPRPMLHSGDYDFSFSGIKTAVLYAIRDHGTLSNDDTMALAAEFETAVVEVLVRKTLAATQQYHTPTVIVGGGVAGNSYLRAQLTEAMKKNPEIALLFPEPWLATDNAIMIAMAAFTRIKAGENGMADPVHLRADGNLSIAANFRK